MPLAVHWLDTHALSIALWLSLTTGLLRVAYAVLSRVLAPYPRARHAVEAVAAASPDVLRFITESYALLTGRGLRYDPARDSHSRPLTPPESR